MRARTSASQACGSMSFNFAVWISVYITAARSPPRSEPANSHDLRPRAMPRSSRSAALLVRQTRPVEEAREGGPALEHIIHRPGNLGVPREFCAFDPHPDL